MADRFDRGGSTGIAPRVPGGSIVSVSAMVSGLKR
jgi:hypothetical protein